MVRVRDLRLLGLLLPILLVMAPWCRAAEFQPAPREVWAGNYKCGAMIGNPDRSPAYTAVVRLTLDDSDASITKESARIRETLSGKVAGDGRLVLQGTGQYKDGGSDWRYRFEGSFEGERFEAKGAMLTARGTKLRDCSMSLRRVSQSQQAKRQAAPAPRSADKVAAATPPAPARSESQPAAAPKPQAAPPAMPPAPAQEAPPSVQSSTAPPPTLPPATAEPTAAATAAPQPLEKRGSAEGALTTRAEIFERLARAGAPPPIAREPSGKAPPVAGKSVTSPQSPNTAARFAPSPAPATQEARPAASSGQAKETERDPSGANKTLVAMLVAVGGVAAVAFGTRKRWLRRTVRNPRRFAVYRVMAADSSFFVSNHVTEESAKHAAACLQACAPAGTLYMVDPPRGPLSSVELKLGFRAVLTRPFGTTPVPGTGAQAHRAPRR